MPFDILLDRRKRNKFLNDLDKASKNQTRPKVVQDAGIALASLVACEEILERELFISTSYGFISHEYSLVNPMLCFYCKN